VTGRAIGCAILGVVVFIAIGIGGLLLVRGPSGCPARLQWLDLAYLPDGDPAPSPSLDEGTPVRIGSTFLGLTTRAVYGPPGSSPSTQAADRPPVIVLDCGDGTFLAYRAAP
jgi:hypothetical protein